MKFIAALAAFLSTATLAAGQPRALLVTGLGTADPDHPKHILQHQFYNDRIVQILGGIVEVTVTEDLASLDRRTLASYDVVLNNSFLLEPSNPQLEALFEFIASGGGYVALHAGLESFVNSDRYVRMMGGRLAGHDAVKTFTVETSEDGFGVDRMEPWSHPIASGIANFETRDEIYVVQTNTDELQVIARAESHPIMWWRPWGAGSVIALTLGHGDYSLESPGYQALLRNSVRWLTGYPIIEPVRRRVFTNDAGSIDDAFDLDEITHARNDSMISFRLTNDRPDLVTATLDQNHRVDLRFTAGRTGTAVIGITAEGMSGRSDSARLEIDVVERGSGNVAAYQAVTAHSSSNEPRYSVANPALVADGDPATRWSSNYVDDAWIYLDLGHAYRLERVRLLWQGAYAAKYELQVSQDGHQWSSVATRTGRGGTEEIRFRPTTGRYVRMLGTQRATRYGYSLHEFEVFGEPIAR